MGTLLVSINSDLSKADLKGRAVKGATLPKESIRGLIDLLEAATAGVFPASVSIAAGVSAPVRASGTLTVVYGTLAATHTVTIAGTVLTCIDSGTATSAQFKKETDGTVTAANLAAAINGNSAINARVSATASGAVVTVTAHAPGTTGNLIALASSAGGVTVSGANLASGAGGPDEAALSFSFGK